MAIRISGGKRRNDVRLGSVVEKVGVLAMRRTALGAGVRLYGGLGGEAYDSRPSLMASLVWISLAGYLMVHRSWCRHRVDIVA